MKRVRPGLKHLCLIQIRISKFICILMDEFKLHHWRWAHIPMHEIITVYRSYRGLIRKSFIWRFLNSIHMDYICRVDIRKNPQKKKKNRAILYPIISIICFSQFIKITRYYREISTSCMITGTNTFNSN